MKGWVLLTPITLSELSILLQSTMSTDDTPQMQVNGVCTDNRDIQHGDAFVAFVGQRVDGHDFVDDAFDRGASVAIVSKPVKTNKGPILHVIDPISAMQRLAKRERELFPHSVIGITGSNGKTTTKQMVAAALSAFGENTCLYTKGNQNNELGLPLTILQRMPLHRSMVLEMGMRGSGQIAALCDIARPNVGVITNIGQSHIELLGSQEAIANAKGELIEALPATGFSILNADDPWLQIISQKIQSKVIWYAIENQHADVRAFDIETRQSGMEFEVFAMGERASMKIPTFGVHNVGNALAAVAVGKVLGISLRDIAEGLSNLEDLSGRLHIVAGHNGMTVIDDCYNASPLSMQASLRTLRDFPRAGTRVAILGDMFELGHYAEEGHRDVGRAVVAFGIDRLISIGQHAQWIADEAKNQGMKDVHEFSQVSDALPAIDSLMDVDMTVLVKASRGMHLESVVAHLSFNEQD